MRALSASCGWLLILVVSACIGDKSAPVDTAALVEEACQIGVDEGSALGADLAEDCEDCPRSERSYCNTGLPISDEVCNLNSPESAIAPCPSTAIRNQYTKCCMYAAYDAYTAGWIAAGCPGEYDRYCFPPSP